jgi:GT2 family glycosyltransferase
MNFAMVNFFNMKNVSVSIVSHRQEAMISQLLLDLDRFCQNSLCEVILTSNLPEELSFQVADFSFPLHILNNSEIKGFGSNHNQAFHISRGDLFCVLNPDIRLTSNPFDGLSHCLTASSIGVVAPKIVGPSGAVEDSARRFPTFKKILRKVISKHWTSDYSLLDKPVDVDWVGGMFMLFRRNVFEKISGFNERYFLYYEDVDVCARLNLAGLRVVVNPSVQVVHHAQHSSHRNLKYLRWHVGSLLRFLTSSEYRQLKRLGRL